MTKDGKWKVAIENEGTAQRYVIYHWNKDLNDWKREGHTRSQQSLKRFFGLEQLEEYTIPDEIPNPWPSKS
jgi:hypothetical protein